MDLSGSQFINSSALQFCHCTINVIVNLKLYNYNINSVSTFQSNIHLSEKRSFSDHKLWVSQFWITEGLV